MILIESDVWQLLLRQYTDNAIQGSPGIAVDANSNKWVAASGINAVSSFSGSDRRGRHQPGSTSAGLNLPTGVATDGAEQHLDHQRRRRR